VIRANCALILESYHEMDYKLHETEMDEIRHFYHPSTSIKITTMRILTASVSLTNGLTS